MHLIFSLLFSGNFESQTCLIMILDRSLNLLDPEILFNKAEKKDD